MNTARLITEGNSLLNHRSNMTVGQLIEALQELPAEATVLFACDYGDYSHTNQALPVTQAAEMTEEEYLTESAYSQSRMAVVSTEDGSPEEDDFCGDAYEAAGLAEGRPQVVILR